MGDHTHGVLEAALGRVAPGEQAVARQNQTALGRVGGLVALQHQAQLKARLAPGQPAHRAFKNLGGQRFAVRHGGNRNHCVGVHVVHMGEGQVGVQGRVDAGGARVQVEGAVRQVGHHLVFKIGAPVQLLQRVQFVHVQGAEAVELHRTHVAARALDPQHGGFLAGQQVLLHQLGRGVAAAVVGDAQVGAQQVRAVQQQAGGIQRGRMGIVPGGEGGGGGGHEAVLEWKVLRWPQV